VITANRWGVEREIENVIDPQPGERVAIYGKGWEDVPRLREFHLGAVEYSKLPDVYRSSSIVIDDTAGPTLPYGAVNARVFDALACGALVVTNCEAGVRELFDDEFPVWSSREDLRRQLDELEADEARREELTSRYRDTVLRLHTYDRRARELVHAIGDHQRNLSFVIRIGAAGCEPAARSEELQLAHSLHHELSRRGHECLIQILSEREDVEASAYDVSITLRGSGEHRPKPGQLNVLWSTSRPQTLTALECEGYDLIAVASSTHAEELTAAVDIPVFTLHGATDPRVFYPDHQPELTHDIVFVGNGSEAGQGGLDWLLPADRDVAIWGEGWAGSVDQRYVDQRYVDAGTLPHDQLRGAYASAKIVLANHGPQMRRYGYVCGPVYDALASGAVVLSDQVLGIEEHLGDAVGVYSTRQELDEMIEVLLGDERLRQSRAVAGRQLLSSAHTVASRVDLLLERVDARWRELDYRIGVTREHRGGLPVSEGGPAAFAVGAEPARS